MAERRPVAVVTGGAAGIGAAVAEELGRQGAYVVTLDPMVSLDGAEQLPTADETTAGRIVAAGGAARASSTSVTDRDAVEALFAELTAEHGGVDAVVNVAGISRPTGFATGTEADWLAVLQVHLDGYLNVLAAALPRMAAAGHGRIVGVTSGSGWRAADAGAYSCAKRAVASLTWQLGRVAPPGVTVNAMSPIAATRMVAAALVRAGGSGRSGGLSLGGMPTPEEIGPTAAMLCSDDIGWCNGQVVFAGGSEVALVDPPRLLEVVRLEGAASSAAVLERFTAGALVAAEAGQVSGGGSNPRFTGVFDEPGGSDQPVAATCAVVVADERLRSAVAGALGGRGVKCELVDVPPPGFAAAADALTGASARLGSLDAVVVALPGLATDASAGSAGWAGVLAEHDGIVERLHADAAWARAAADLAAAAGRPLRLVTLTDATTHGGRSRAQSSAQLARSARGATDARVGAFAVSLESATAADHAGDLAAHLVGSEAAAPLAGAELVVGPGWVGLRSHPRPSASITFGGPAIPAWLPGTLRAAVGAEPREA